MPNLSKTNFQLSDVYVPGMVSIVIPTYNRAKFLKESIDSALGQDYPSSEVIVVDDGSTDETSQICRGYADQIRYYWKPNGGPASAMNFGIMKMSGEWLKVLGDDDVLESNALSTFIEMAIKLNARSLSCDYLVINEKGCVLRRAQPPKVLNGDEFRRALWCSHSHERIMIGGAANGSGFIHRS